jgi:hypothetical protein
VLALTVIAGAAEVSAHRRDEYLQAARVAVEPDAVHLELDLTPGIALAETIIADIDRNRDGSLSLDEQRAYASLVLGALTLEVDGRPVQAQLGATRFPDAESMRRGEGTIRLHSTATLPRLTMGRHKLLFRNGHDPDRSVYLANALVPDSDDVAISAQRRDGVQRELTIDYVLHAALPTSTEAWMLGSIAGAMVLMLGFRRSRSITWHRREKSVAAAKPARRSAVSFRDVRRPSMRQLL